MFSDELWSRVCWDKDNMRIVSPQQFAELFPKVKAMVIDLVTECGTTAPTTDFSLHGGCDTGGWFHLSDIRRSRIYYDQPQNRVLAAMISTMFSTSAGRSQCN